MTRAPIAFLGLGAMGRRMAARLAAEGLPVVVWNRSPEACEGFDRVAATPAGAAVGAALAIVMVTDAAAVEEVTRELPRDLLLVDMSTSGPEAARRLGARFAAACDAPVGGSLSEAEEGTLTVYLGGDEAAADRAEPVLAHLGTVFRMGPLGSGQAIKVIGNMLMMSNVAALGEGMTMVERHGIDPDRALEALAAGPGSSRAITAKGPAIARGTFGPPARFPLRLAHKDAGLARAMGGGPVSELVERLYADALAAGRGDQDYSAVAARR